MQLVIGIITAVVTAVTTIVGSYFKFRYDIVKFKRQNSFDPLYFDKLLSFLHPIPKPPILIIYTFSFVGYVYAKIKDFEAVGMSIRVTGGQPIYRTFCDIVDYDTKTKRLTVRTDQFEVTYTNVYISPDKLRNYSDMDQGTVIGHVEGLVGSQAHVSMFVADVSDNCLFISPMKFYLKYLFGEVRYSSDIFDESFVNAFEAIAFAKLDEDYRKMEANIERKC